MSDGSGHLRCKQVTELLVLDVAYTSAKCGGRVMQRVSGLKASDLSRLRGASGWLLKMRGDIFPHWCWLHRRRHPHSCKLLRKLTYRTRLLVDGKL